MNPGSVVIIEPNADARNQLRQAFETRGYLTWSCPEVEWAASILTAVVPDILFVDLDAEGDGIFEWLEEIHAQSLKTRLIAGGAQDQPERLAMARRLGIETFLPKPLPMSRIFSCLEQPASMDKPPRLAA